jgi:GNAT superfamily N-acetyltransferase
MQYELRQATEADEEWAYRLNDRCYRDLVVRQFGEWDEKWQREHFAQKWTPSDYRIIVYEGNDAGVLCVRSQGDCTFLAEIQIDPQFQKQGLGTAIVGELIGQARREGLPLRLRVLRRNRARRLYSRLGFSQIGETETHVLLEKRHK